MHQNTESQYCVTLLKGSATFLERRRVEGFTRENPLNHRKSQEMAALTGGPVEDMGPLENMGPVEPLVTMGPPEDFGPLENMGPAETFGPPIPLGPLGPGGVRDPNGTVSGISISRYGRLICYNQTLLDSYGDHNSWEDPSTLAAALPVFVTQLFVANFTYRLIYYLIRPLKLPPFVAQILVSISYQSMLKFFYACSFPFLFKYHFLFSSSD